MAKKDPPGTRVKDGKKYVPPAPQAAYRRQNVGRAGNYAADLESTGDPEMNKTLNIRKRRKPK